MSELDALIDSALAGLSGGGSTTRSDFSGFGNPFDTMEFVASGIGSGGAQRNPALPNDYYIEDSAYNRTLSDGSVVRVILNRYGQEIATQPVRGPKTTGTGGGGSSLPESSTVAREFVGPQGLGLYQFNPLTGSYDIFLGPTELPDAPTTTLPSVDVRSTPGGGTAGIVYDPNTGQWTVEQIIPDRAPTSGSSRTSGGSGLSARQQAAIQERAARLKIAADAAALNARIAADQGLQREAQAFQAQQAALNRQLDALQFQANFGLQRQQLAGNLASQLAEVVSSTDPAAYAALLMATESVPQTNITNALAQGGTALSERAALPAARTLSAIEGLPTTTGLEGFINGTGTGTNGGASGAPTVDMSFLGDFGSMGPIFHDPVVAAPVQEFSPGSAAGTASLTGFRPAAAPRFDPFAPPAGVPLPAVMAPGQVDPRAVPAYAQDVPLAANGGDFQGAAIVGDPKTGDKANPELVMGDFTVIPLSDLPKFRDGTRRGTESTTTVTQPATTRSDILTNFYSSFRRPQESPATALPELEESQLDTGVTLSPDAERAPESLTQEAPPVQTPQGEEVPPIAPPPIAAPGLPTVTFDPVTLTPSVLPTDQANIDRIMDLRQNVQFPQLNPLATNFSLIDPVIQELFLRGRQSKFGIPVQSQLAEIQRQFIPGVNRGSLSLGL